MMHPSSKLKKRAREEFFQQYQEDSGGRSAGVAEAEPSEPENCFRPRVSKQVKTTPAFSPHCRKYVFPKEAVGVSDKLVGDKELFAASSSAGESDTSRSKVIEVLKLYRETRDKLLKENEEGAVGSRKICTIAAMNLQKQHKWINTAKRLGPVPGVEIGDKFQFRAELCIVGVHSLYQKGIDYMYKNGIPLATSIVATARYANEMKSSGVLIYCGEGGNTEVKGGGPIKGPIRTSRANLALCNSIKQETPVRVVLSPNCRRSKLSSIRGRNVATAYMYDGLYMVEKSLQRRGEFGKLVYTFQLRRIPEQPTLIRAFPGADMMQKSCKPCQPRVAQGFPATITKEKSCCMRGPLIDDISGGKEQIPIPVVNEVDELRPPLFTYATNMTYPHSNNRTISHYCDCANQCFDAIDCPCKIKNGQEIPYDNNGRLIMEKPCIYECGSSCLCSDSCTNRASQVGIQFPLEVFKTNKSKGWGVRSRSKIPSGSFVCEYVGKVISSKEAAQKIGSSDEYLFHIENYSAGFDLKKKPQRLRNSRPSISSRKDIGGFAIDAAEYGNVARFINHSCSPNLCVQKVVYDHHEMSHIMLFAKRDIHPNKELSYDYKHRLEGFCHNENLKAKKCCCPSLRCVGKFY